MKKTLIIGLGLCAALGMTSCKSQESAYRKAYLQAQQNQQNQQQNYQNSDVIVVDDDDVSVTPVTPQQNQQTTVKQQENYDNTPVRTIDGGMQVVSGQELRTYSVVVGSFVSQANAEGLCNQLRQAGRDARVIKTNETINGHTGWFRVIASSFDSKASAAQSRNELSAQYPGAWLLYRK
ncbi:MAG: SPOR domain-containing protein [Alloprevotella sp.]|nr:SPOR domain-containing protein [Alloprevotella sp.]MBR1652286.1 SPOR domain-containing protein [Alloprevotella sp.]